MSRESVAIVQRVVPPYRVRLFELIREELGSLGIDFELIVGTGEQLRGGANTPPDWARSVPARHLGLGSKHLEYQPVVREALRHDLAIFEQASKDIHTTLLLCAPRRTRIGLWGHGSNLQTSTVSAVGERLKRSLLSRADWFWAYTPATTESLVARGFPDDRITTLVNTVDGTTLRQELDRLSSDDRQHLRSTYGVGRGPVGLFLSRLYDLKRPEFAIETAIAIRERVPDFTLVVIGDGPRREVTRRAAAQHEWIVDLGALHGAEIAPWLDLADILLQPGMVGLAAVDALACGVPVASILEQQHSPEFSYLVDGHNALLLSRDVSAQEFADAIVDLITDRAPFAALRRSTEADRDRYRIETMANDFTAGIQRALQQPRRSRT